MIDVLFGHVADVLCYIMQFASTKTNIFQLFVYKN